MISETLSLSSFRRKPESSFILQALKLDRDFRRGDECWEMGGSSPAMTIPFSIVITGLDPVIALRSRADGRIRSGHDDVRSSSCASSGSTRGLTRASPTVNNDRYMKK